MPRAVIRISIVSELACHDEPYVFLAAQRKRHTSKFDRYNASRNWIFPMGVTKVFFNSESSTAHDEPTLRGVSFRGGVAGRCCKLRLAPQKLRNLAE